MAIRVTTVDYVVLCVSFLGMKQERFDHFIKLLSVSNVVEVRRAAASLAERARKRYDTKLQTLEGQTLHKLDWGRDGSR